MMRLTMNINYIVHNYMLHLKYQPGVHSIATYDAKFEFPAHIQKVKFTKINPVVISPILLKCVFCIS